MDKELLVLKITELCKKTYEMAGTNYKNKKVHNQKMKEIHELFNIEREINYNNLCEVLNILINEEDERIIHISSTQCLRINHNVKNALKKLKILSNHAMNIFIKVDATICYKHFIGFGRLPM